MWRSARRKNEKSPRNIEGITNELGSSYSAFSIVK